MVGMRLLSGKNVPGHHWLHLTVSMVLGLSVLFIAPRVNARGVDLLKLRTQAVTADRNCKKTRSLRQCKRALRLYKKALKAMPGNPRIIVRIRNLQAIIRAIAPKAYRPHYKGLIAAARVGSLRDVKYFLKHGANPDLTDDTGRTALHYAAQLGMAGMRVMKMLLTAGADPNIQDNHGLTPLHLAALGSSARTVKALLKAGADPSITNNEGQTPYDVAVGGAKTALTARLRVKGPANAMVKVDNQLVGFTDAAGILDVSTGPGTHRITVKKTNYQEFKKRVVLSIGDQRLQTNLKPIPRPVPKNMAVRVSRPEPKIVAKKGLQKIVVKTVKPVIAKKKPVKHPAQRQAVTVFKPVVMPGHTSTLHKWSIASIATGLAIIGVGGLMTGLAQRTANDIRGTELPGNLDSKYSRLHMYNALAITSYVLGVALVGTGIYLWMRKDAGHEVPQVSALVAPNSVGITVRY